eukprot:8104354-Alexandrium_andersonii.AAC.1
MCPLAFVRVKEHLRAKRDGLSKEGTPRGHFARRLSFELLASRQAPTGRIQVREEGPARSLSLIHI